VLREVDTLARLGGDEFVLLLSELTDGDHCFKVLDRVLAMVSAPIRIENVTVAVSASIGVTVYPGDEVDAETLLRHADQAMYQAKQEGRNRYRLFDPEGERRRHAEAQLLAQLSQALEKTEFSLHYQPMVNLQTGQVVGLEALLRWQHPDRGLIAPVGFLSHLMGSDLETAVGLWVIENAVGQLSAWRQSMPLPGFCLRVNISPRQLMAEDFLEQLDRVLKSHPGVGYGDLELEIQESTALLDMERVAEVVRTGQKLGFRFSFDDFGTGGFSLAHFRRLPVNSLKIDRSFVEQMGTSAGHLDIVESIIGLGRAFAMEVVAEGVETPEQRLQLLAMGCPLAQGYAIARPMPALEFQAWLERWNRANV
jgi:predicted signal transduction protein with EAL and GGDEF domain